MRKPKTNRKQSFYSKDKDEQKIFVKLRKEFKKVQSELSFEEWVMSNIAYSGRLDAQTILKQLK